MTAPYSDCPEVRQAIIDACLHLNAKGINQGTSGNVSVRAGASMLITPSGIPYSDMTPDMIQSVPLDATPTARGPLKPSSEWRFHQALLTAKPDSHAIVHAHPVHCTALAQNRQPIPAVHYMVAAFGGHDVPLAGYALFGGEELAKNVVNAMTGRHACLMANHGATVVGETLDKALWRMEELETLARGYVLSLSAGTPHVLDRFQIEEALAAFADYGPRD
ncbi:class II aldolase/adducin family protein [Nioella nitratireducens]|uniref:class II aldolase/adducin family protein n=1 Tax=Nioella nitratireducens TaxID=1287720 RepID=UPI0008FD553F|nr:class II aldolase/adducin family protein [Nioella nitratireducens]